MLDSELITLWQEERNYLARNELVMRYMPAVYKQSMKYPVNHLVNRYDLIQEGVIGLIRAVDKFDLSKKTCFWTCAYYYVMDQMYDYSTSHIPHLSGGIPDFSGEKIEDELIEELTNDKLLQILETECTEREKASVKWRLSNFVGLRPNLAGTQIARGWDSAIKHIQGAICQK